MAIHFVLYDILGIVDQHLHKKLPISFYRAQLLRLNYVRLLERSFICC
jgi:hypothetical protein